jgi:signal transduction histidine kinase
MSDELLGNSDDSTALQSTQLRTALQSILGFTQLLQVTGENLKPVQLRYLANIESAASQLLAHVSAANVKPVRLVFERVVIDLDESIVRVLDQLTSLADAEGVTLQAQPSGLTIVGDREQLEQMLLNLLGCAIRSTPARSTVRIRANRLGEGVQLRITDTEIGIPREVTTAKRLAEMMGGELEWAQESTGRTGISVRLPAPPPAS